MDGLNQVFGKEVLKETKLLSLLYKQPSFFSISELSEKLKMDRRSIYKYFDLLLTLPYAQNHKNVLVAKHGKGYKFNGTKKDYKILSRQILQTNPFFELIEELLLTNKINITQFAYDNFLSESLIQKKINLLKQQLNTIEIDVKKTNGVLNLVGDEEKIRFFIVSFFWKNYHGVHWPFSGISQAKCKETISFFLKDNNIELSPVKIELSCYILATTVMRSRKGFPILKSNISTLKKSDIFNSYVSSYLVDKVEKFNDSLFNHLHSKYLLKENEVEYLTMIAFREPFFILRIIQHETKFLTALNKQTLIDQVLYTSQLKKLFDNSDNQIKRLFISSIISGIISTEVIGKTSYTISGYSIEKYIQSEYPVITSVINDTLYKKSIYKDNVSKRTMLAMYLSIAYSLLTPPAQKQKVVKIRMETDLSILLETLVIERIQDVFKSFYHLEISSKIPEHEADFCLCTNYLTLDFINIDAVLINAQVSAQDFLTINNKIQSILQTS